jgi:ribosomal protein L14
MCVGYAKPGSLAEVKPRLPQAAVLHRERYDYTREAGLIASYDRTMTVFSKRNETARTTWIDRVFRRMTKIAHLAGRDRMRRALNALGFELR